MFLVLEITFVYRLLTTECLNFSSEFGEFVTNTAVNTGSLQSPICLCDGDVIAKLLEINKDNSSYLLFSILH